MSVPSLLGCTARCCATSRAGGLRDRWYGRPVSDARETATLGGGCFWCLDAAYRRIDGVHEVVSGYAAGARPNPTYEQVCSGRTGHAEVVQVTYDPAVIDYAGILEVLWAVHDPTQVDRQGNDVGTQYRSIILTHDESQRAVAQASIAEAQTHWSRPIATQVEPLTVFYPAEDYHQDYFTQHPENGYCAVVINPKLAKLREKVAGRLRAGV